MRNSWLCYLLLVLALGACTHSGAVFQEMEAIDGAWGDEVSFEYESEDSLRPMNTYFMIRADEEYPYSNIYIISSVESPKGEVVVDTLQYQMAEADGRLLGEGFSSMKESLLMYRMNHIFKEKGVYKFQLKHATRKHAQEKTDEVLRGVYGVGLLIEKSDI